MFTSSPIVAALTCAPLAQMRQIPSMPFKPYSSVDLVSDKSGFKVFVNKMQVAIRKFNATKFSTQVAIKKEIGHRWKLYREPSMVCTTGGSGLQYALKKKGGLVSDVAKFLTGAPNEKKGLGEFKRAGSAANLEVAQQLMGRVESTESVISKGRQEVGDAKTTAKELRPCRNITVSVLYDTDDKCCVKECKKTRSSHPTFAISPECYNFSSHLHGDAMHQSQDSVLLQLCSKSMAMWYACESILAPPKQELEEWIAASAAELDEDDVNGEEEDEDDPESDSDVATGDIFDLDDLPTDVQGSMEEDGEAAVGSAEAAAGEADPSAVADTAVQSEAVALLSSILELDALPGA